MEFYNVKKRQKVKVADDEIKKTTYTGKGGTMRYAARGVDDDGTKLTKFVSKDVYDSLDVPME